ncbi:CMRF35-like molecule 5 isoform X5 [Ictalurus punctatus]|uniref:CMRF35-like molecule 5 isoform X5 n=1 Tax=Ictalurus punctatus TaxID=7998 RepID=A0A2D0Q4I2_ICTPU|nr:CMRF35-like molecule 5 isoform X5 [Ictalurus punctatus]
MKILLIFTFCLIIAGSDAVTTVTGYRGRSVQIKCPYGSGYEEYKKYLCRGKCPRVGYNDVPVRSGSPAKDIRFSLYDNTTAKVFTVTITDLRTEDGNTYWCVIERTGYDLYTELLLLVKTEDPAITTVSHTTHSASTHSASTQSASTHSASTHSASTHSMSPSVPAEITHSTTGAVLLAVGVIIAIYCKIHRQGSETVTRSSTEANGDYENDQNLPPLQAKEKANLPESVYQSLDLTTNQSVYQSLTFTNNQ